MKWFGSKKPGPCKGICVQYRAQKPASGGRYESGQSRCQVCGIYLTEEGLGPGKNEPSGESLYCKCCGYRVRTLPRNKAYKEKYKESVVSKTKWFDFGKKENEKETEEPISDEDETQTREYDERNQDVVVYHQCPQCQKSTYRLSEAKEIFGTTTARISSTNPYGLQSWCKNCRTGSTSDNLFTEGEKTFSELQRFLESEIVLQANYQLVLLEYLVENGSGTKRDIAKKLARQNYEDSSNPAIIQKYLYVPVYQVLKDRGFIKEALDDSTYVLLNVTLSYDARTEILEILKRRLLEYNKTHKLSEDSLTKTTLSYNESPEFHTALGPWSNWKQTINNLPIRWGVAYNSPAINEYRSLRRGDIVFYYVTQDEPNPFTKRGFFGVGRVIKKYEAYDQFWPDEVNQGKVIYPYRFDLETLKIVAYDDDVLPWIDGLPFTEGLNHITNQEKLDQLLHNLKAKWGIEFKTIKQESAQEDYDDQLARQEQIIEKNPKDENAWYQKARILSILNREEEALHALIVVTSIWPESKSKIRHDDAFDNIRHSEMFNILTQN
ncbi:MAG TPA: hypothetical protein VFA69_06160 [Candidatus Nitrosotalea sp.]|nr:hypothetical protein [Candidatus Nitrosotalea sp.]